MYQFLVAGKTLLHLSLVPFVWLNVAMNSRFRAPIWSTILILVTSVFAMSAQTPKTSWQPAQSETLQRIVDDAAQKTLQQFAAKHLKPEELAITVIDLKDREKPSQASYHGNVPIYPASVIKLFYLVAAHQALEDNRIQDTDELRRALRDMIVDSLNEATGYIVDLVTDTTSGPELPQKEIEVWFDKRNAVNRYFTSLGYTNINVNKKPWCEGPYGRETQATKLFTPKRNALTTDATARLMTEIVTGKAVSPKHCEEMMALLKRDPFGKAGGPDDQAHAYTGASVPQGTKLWSKAGWTSEVRHDAAYVELPNGAKFVVVVFTANHAGEKTLVPFVAKAVVENMK